MTSIWLRAGINACVLMVPHSVAYPQAPTNNPSGLQIVTLRREVNLDGLL
jgi:hypothetical protein